MMLIMRCIVFLLLSFLVLIISNCEMIEESDNTPPNVTITFPQDGSIVCEIVNITCVSTDNEGIDRVELWVDGISTGISDKTEPYSMEWNTTTYEDSSSHTITVRSHDVNDNKTDSDPITVIVDNSTVHPNSINIRSITYTTTQMTIMWEVSKDDDFSYYELLESETESGDKSLIVIVSEKYDTTYVLTEFDPSRPTWYWISVTDTFGFYTIGDGYFIMDDYPTRVEINSIIYQDGYFIICWSPSPDNDFANYELYESSNENMSDKEAIFKTNDVNDTTYIADNISLDEKRYYRLLVTDLYGLVSSSSIAVGSSFLKIAFVSERDDDIDQNIYIMDIDGSKQIRLTNFSEYVDFPQFSPDGSKIIFYYKKDNNTEIYIMDVYGKNITNLTNNPSRDEFPQFSPCGSKIVFYSDRDGNGEIYLMDIDGKSLTNLTNNSSNDWSPCFSPDGSKIAFSSDRGVGSGKSEIYIMNVSGTNQTRLTNSKEHKYNVQFSPDGLKIIYISAGTYDIFIMNDDGGNITNITNDIINRSSPQPRFSPHGTKIVFEYDKDIHIMDIDGNNKINLTNSYENDKNPEFSPDGSKIVFDSYRDGNNEIYIMNIDGSEQTNLTNNPACDRSPKFQPRS